MRVRRHVHAYQLSRRRVEMRGELHGIASAPRLSHSPSPLTIVQSVLMLSRAMVKLNNAFRTKRTANGVPQGEGHPVMCCTTAKVDTREAARNSAGFRV